MEKQEQLEKIKLEYDLFKCDEDFGVDASLQAIANKFEDLEFLRDIVNTRRKKNRKDRFISNLLGKYAERFGYLDSWYYYADDNFLDKKDEILNNFYQQLGSIYVKMNDDNYREVYKLLKFTSHKTGSYLASIDEDRFFIRQSVNGKPFERKLPKEESDVFNQFFRGALASISYTGNVEKVKK